MRDTSEPPFTEKRPLVAIGYGPRCVPVMQLTQAAAGICDLLWMIDGSLPEMRQMMSLLNRFGPVIDISGLDTDQILKELSSPFVPDGIVTYLDANMTLFAQIAETLGLPFHSVATAIALTDKAEQRRVLAEGGLAGPPSLVISPDDNESDFPDLEANIGWPAVLKPRSAQGSRYTFKVVDRDQLGVYLAALGADRPEMVLEGYLNDDPARRDSPYAPYVSVESVVARGSISHLALTGRFPLAENFRETGFFIPASLSTDDRVVALELATSAINALGIRTGCLHTEVKFTSDGARVIEVNGRVGGGVPEMLERASGVSLVPLTLRIALGDDVRFDEPVATECVGYRFFLQPPAVSATVASINGLDTVSDFPGVGSITVHQGPGADFDWKDGSRNHIMAVVGTAHDYDELLSVDRLLHQEVTVTYANVSYY